MTNPATFLARACTFACILFMASSCKDTDEFFSNEDDKTNATTANTFDFSTTQEVDLIVDYSDFETLGPVKFSVYATNPIVGKNTDYEHLNENIKPLIELYTDDNGKFDQTLTLPSYAKVLHIVTGNLAIGFDHSIVEVVNNEAKVVVKNDGTTMDIYYPTRATRATWEGEPTNELGKLISTGYKVNSSGNATSTQVYNTWHTPLGHWNTASGHPVDYLLDKTKVTTPGLVLSQKEVDDMYNEVCNILPNNTGIDNSHYRTSADVTLKEESEVTITALGSFTCWNSSLAYYYYTEGTKPTDRMDLNPIMLFPNTQDGKRYGDDNSKQTTYKGNIGMIRGDVIQLMYYPNIANNDYSGATTKFPKGTKIGFLMRTNGWGMMGDEFCTKTYKNAQNIWVSSTEGMSFAEPFSGKTFKKPNPNGEARTAMFSYTASDNTKYCILAFEDACDDTDYNDLIFALNPSNVFLGLNDVEKDKTTISGVYAFEDRWPQKADYDMNDVMLDYTQELTFTDGKISKQTISLTTYQNFVSDVSGLAARLVFKTKPTTIEMKKAAKNNTASAAQFDYDGEAYYLTSNITGELGSTYIFELTYSTPQSIENIASIQPFLYRDEIKDGKESRWEVHIPYEAPTSKMDKSYFGKGSDASNVNAKRYYVSSEDYPFAFYMANARIDYFTDNILKRDNESKPIDTFFPEFIEWSKSKGKKNADWYLHPQNE